MSSKSKKEVRSIVDALDEVPLDDAEVKATVDKLGVDVKAMAAGIRAKVAAADASDRQKRFDAAKAAYADEVMRLAASSRRSAEQHRTRDENLTVFRALLVKAPAKTGAPVAMHFLKYESASDEELEELVRSLQHLLGEDEPEDGPK